MKRTTILLFILTFSLFHIQAQHTPAQNCKYTDASSLTIIGKIVPTPNPYHRVDTMQYKGFEERENKMVRCGCGIAILFKTNTKSITLKSEFGYVGRMDNMAEMSTRGFDLYIKDHDKWMYAASAVSKDDKINEPLMLLNGMDGSERECMLYLPIYSELLSLQIGIDSDAVITALPSPFRYRIGVFGSSYTQGIGTSRAGMNYPMQLMRKTGLQFINMGFSGRCKMQPYFTKVLCDADVDALVFDAFSNSSAELIQKRLESFIVELQQAHPDIPLIFQQTITVENQHFNKRSDSSSIHRQQVAAQLMKEMCKKYKNVYFLKTNAADANHETSTDGSHPNDYGYTIWMQSIEKPLLKILNKYGIQ